MDGPASTKHMLVAVAIDLQLFITGADSLCILHDSIYIDKRLTNTMFY